MFANEYEYLIHLIKCAIHNLQPEEKPKDLSFEKVFAYGKKHEVANIAFVSVEKLKIKPEEALYKMWKTVYVFSIQRHTNQMQARDTIVDALHQTGIRTVELQGTVIKTLYPKPFWRMMSDIDFIIEKEHLERAGKIMQNLGYEIKQVGDYEIDAFGANKIAVELHTDFFPPSSIYYDAIPNIFKNLDLSEDTIFYLYNLLHCMKHYLQSGVGIRRILDMYILDKEFNYSSEVLFCKEEKIDNLSVIEVNKSSISEKRRVSEKHNKFNLKNVDFSYIEAVLLRYNLKETVEEVIELAQLWFGNYDLENKKDLSETIQFVYLSENHGTVKAQLNNEYKQKKISNKVLFKFYKVIQLIFPKKEVVYIRYPICKKYHVPIILAWLYRGGCIVLNKKRRKNALKILSEIKKVKLE